MASPNSTFTEIISTTLRQHRQEFADNVSNNNALLQRLMTKRPNHRGRRWLRNCRASRLRREQHLSEIFRL